MSHENMDYEGIMHRAGHRVTTQRLIILDAVCERGGHTTLKQVSACLRRMDPTIDRSSVYRTLKLFVALGLVVSAQTAEGETVYEIPKPHRHHHLICRRCGVEQEVGPDVIDEMFGRVTRQYGFTPEMDHLVLYGLCADCRAASEDVDPASLKRADLSVEPRPS